MLSRTELKVVFPRARAPYIEALAGNPELLASAGLNDRLAYAHFLARVAAETGGLSIAEESGNYSADRLRAVWPSRFSKADAKVYAHKPQAILNRAYARKDLGNGPESSGDGWRYRGRSFLQTTGRYNYRRVGELIGVDLVNNPDLLAQDAVLGLKAAVIEWRQLNLSSIVAGLGPTHAACVKVAKGINCGSVNSNKQPNGLDHQKTYFAEIWRAVSGERNIAKKLNPLADGILEEGEEGDPVFDLQKRLLELGYPVGNPDGIFGQRTAAAVAALQMREGLGGDPGKYRTEWAKALANAEPFADDGRRNATADDLAEKGHKPVRALQRVKQAGAGLGTFLGLDQVFGVSESSTFSGIVDGVRNTFEPLGFAFSWLSGNKLALAVVGCLLLYLGANWLIGVFVKDHRSFGNAADLERAEA